MGGVGYLWAYWVPLSVAAALLLGGPFSWVPALSILLLHPLADHFSPRLRSQVESVSGAAGLPEAALPNTPWLPEAALLLYPLIQTGILVWALGQVSEARWLFPAVTVGLMTGALGMTVAHELVHRASAWQRAMGVLLLVQVSYAHFRIEHVFGHHAKVATPEDPASARPGETLYGFWLRSIFFSIVSAWRIERRRLENRGAVEKKLGNRMVHYALLQSALFAGVWFSKGMPGILFHVIQSAVAILLLELINYVEHYGIQRRALGNGRYEPVTAAHSWDSDHRMTNWFLFNLGRHSEHHTHPRKPFEKLTNPDGARMLPYGYSTLMLLAMVPPLFFRVMDRRCR